MEVFIQALVFLVVIILALLSFKVKFKSERKYDKHVENSLMEEYIIDPSTGRKITLEEAESGHWIDHDNEFQTIPDDVIDNHFSDEDKEVVRTLNYLKSSKEYLIVKDTQDALKVLEQSIIFQNYKDWSYSSIYKLSFADGFALIHNIQLSGPTYLDNVQEETHFLFLLKLGFETGNYVLRPKNIAEKFLDLIKSDDDLEYPNYECFTFQKGPLFRLQKIINQFTNLEHTIFEFIDGYLIIKSVTWPTRESVLTVEEKIKGLKEAAFL